MNKIERAELARLVETARGMVRVDGKSLAQIKSDNETAGKILEKVSEDLRKSG